MLVKQSTEVLSWLTDQKVPSRKFKFNVEMEQQNMENKSLWKFQVVFSSLKWTDIVQSNPKFFIVSKKQKSF